MKRLFFLLLAVVLLDSMSSSAQVTEAELQRADVNGDGNVDVADMVGIIDIINNVGKTDGDYKYYLGIATNEQAEDIDYLNSLIQNSSSMYHGKPTTLTLPHSESNDGLIIWIYDERMGYPNVTHNGFGTGDMDYDEIGLNEPDGYKIKLWDLKELTFDIKWVAPHLKNVYNLLVEYEGGDVNNDGKVNQTDLKVVIDIMKKIEKIDDIKYGMLFLPYEQAIAMSSEDYTKWITEQMNNVTTTYSHRPSRVLFPPTSEKGEYIWVYPTFFGKVKDITAFSGVGVGCVSADDCGITPPVGYDFFVREADGGKYSFNIIWK